MLHYRHATRHDLAEIVAIYNSIIADRMVTADTEPVTVESREAWFEAHNTTTRPLFMVENEANETLAWLSFQSFYGRPAYNATAEISIYLHENHRKKGLGKQILAYSIAIAPDFGIKTLLGFIFEHNTPSLNLFYGLGFQDWANLPNIALLDDTERSLIIVGKRIA
jgi:L-amino acid N-acyltransferase YncA